MAWTHCPACWAKLRVGGALEHILSCKDELVGDDPPATLREPIGLSNAEAVNALKHLRIVCVKTLTTREKETLRSVSNRNFDSDMVSKTDLARIGDILKRVYGKKKESP